MIRAIFFVLTVVICISKVNAQTCIDSTRIVYGGYCDPRWEPVCGCDGFTYQNECTVLNAGLLYYQQGICDPVDFSFTPNPPYDYIYVDAMLKTTGNMYVQLTDRFGRVFYSNGFSGVNRFQFQIQVRGYPAGIYFLHIYNESGSRVKKVVISGLE
jgi:hypothetical protein